MWPRTATASHPRSSPSIASEKRVRALWHRMFESPPQAIAHAVQQHPQVVGVDIERRTCVDAGNTLNVDEEHREPFELGEREHRATKNIHRFASRERSLW